jgi:hypothetical protein
MSSASTSKRGYGWKHQKLRAQWAKRIENGEIVRCSRCGGWIHPQHKWDLGHVDGSGKTLYAGPEHASCNRRTSAHKAERKRRAPYAFVDHPVVSRRW